MHAMFINILARNAGLPFRPDPHCPAAGRSKQQPGVRLATRHKLYMKLYYALNEINGNMN